MIPLKLTRAHSPTKDTGRVFNWLVADGDEVTSGQPLVEIELGRVTMELESPGNGVVHILVQRGTTVPVGGTLAEIRSPSEITSASPQPGAPEPEAAEPEPEPEPEAEAAPEPEPEAAPEPEPQPAPAPVAAEPEPVAAASAAAPASPEGPLATPAARRLAEEVGVDLAEVTGTGPDGRILAEDVEKLVASRPATQLITSIETQETSATEPEAAPETEAEPEPVAETAVPAADAASEPPAVEAAPVAAEPDPEPVAPEPEPAAAQPSAPAAETPPAAPAPVAAEPAPPVAAEPPAPPAPPPAPEPQAEPEPVAAPAAAAAPASQHIHLGGELAADGLVDAHRAATRKFEGKTTVTDLLIMVVARALTEVPELNGTIGDDGAAHRDAAVHLALADASDDPAQAPVLRNAPSLKLDEIAKERTRLAEAAGQGTLGGDDLSGATCTFSNLGGYPLDFYVPSGAGDQIALITTGRVMEKPISFQRMLTIRPRMWVSVALDSRGADSETGGRFLAALQKRLNELPNAI